jgi:ABC-type amino acid transport substrate-binding protein
LRTDIGLISALSIVVGMVLGAGAFMKPPAVMAAAGDSTWALAAWIIGAILIMAGGLTLCELGVLYPHTGGVKSFSTGEMYMNNRPGYTLQRLSLFPDLARLYKSGVIDAIVFDKSVIDDWLARGVVQGRSIILGDPEAYAIAYRKTDAKLGQEMNKALENIINNGKLEEIQKKWPIAHKEEFSP